MATRAHPPIAPIDLELPHADHPVRGSRRARPFLLTERDLELLAFVAVHRFVLAAHVHSWLGVDRAVAYRRLAGLVGAGLLSYERIFHAQPGCYLITNGGLGVIDSDLPRPSVDLRCYGHDTGIVWCWLAAINERFGAVDRLLSERELRSHDQRPNRADRRFGIPVDGYDRNGNQRVHYPDLVMVRPDGGRVAIELELSVKGRRRLEAILLGYHAAPQLGAVLYLTDSRRVANVVKDTVATYGLRELVQVRYFPSPPHTDRVAGRGQVWRSFLAGAL
jgi:hypothetical protein